MIPFLTDTLSPPGPGAVALPQPGAGLRDGGAGLDFAGVLDAALPAEAAPPPPPSMFAAPPALPSAGLPVGTILPEPGTALPDDAAQIAPPAETIVTEDVAAEDGTATENAEPLPAPPPAPPIILMIAPATSPPAPVRPVARPLLHPSAPPAQLARAPMPAQVALPEPDSAAAQPAVLPASPTAPVPDVLAEALAEAAPTAAAPSSATPAAATSSVPPAVSAQLQPVTATITAASEARIAPQQDSAIAQVGELREALRAARPEMTLRHAEFGNVSLRIEATGAQDWRAVLASRDPGFVPAIQAALAERAVAASTETSASNSGSHHGQSGQSEQRYGFSQGSGQGSSQPYMEQSGKRDEGASSHQRQQRSEADAAARAKGPEAEQQAPRDRGLFA
jgi:hypothetical protein